MQLLVAVFDNPETAHEARSAVRDLERQLFVAVEDAAVISRDATGRTWLADEAEGDVKAGARVGALAGLLIGFGAPALGIAMGAAGGALPARSAHRGLDDGFVQALEAKLQPGTSALAIVFLDANPAALRAALEPFRGRAIQTRVDPELAEQLRDVLKQ
jgi:uncharacterized membrane protein